MKRKIRIFSNIAIICLSVCMFAFGVYAASTVSVTTSGTVTFSATGVYAKITGSIAGVSETGLTYAELTTNADGTITGDTSSWVNKNVTFNSGNEITLTITVQNLATEEGRNVYATLYDIDQPEKLKTTMLLGSEKYLASTVVEIAPNTSKIFQVKLSPRDLNTSFTADYEYLLDLDSDKLNSERIESKIKTGVNNSEYGSMSYSLDSTKTKLTLTAEPNDGYEFLGFTGGSINDGDFVFVGYTYGDMTSTEVTLNLNLFDNRAYYAIFYTELIDAFSEDESVCLGKYFIGSNYCAYATGTSINGSSFDIPKTKIYENKEYNVAFLSCTGGGGSPFVSNIVEYIIPEHISGLIGSYNWNIFEGLSSLNLKFILSDNAVCIEGSFVIPNGNTYWINNKKVINYLSEDSLMLQGSLNDIYINEKYSDYIQYNEWFAENYEKTATTSVHSTGTYYLYSPKSSS